MNILEAKEQIKKTIHIYLKKDTYGEYRIPVSKQRPVFLIGAPGIGKTAIIEQIAQEMDIALVAYSMTHHTRQSALGLPFFEDREYAGKSFKISGYTMSEIIATIYETMERSKKTQGILFLDEINCVSETLTPSMLQFLQYKTFGRHQIPEGWVVITAGNPPEYNRSVHDFDIVTLDRLKLLQVEPDYETWKAYAVNRGIHQSILSFLDMNRNYFYSVKQTASGKEYITARGWEDLSHAITLYEESGFEVDETMIGGYIHHASCIQAFSDYYHLYISYQQKYHIREILAGAVTAEIVEEASGMAWEEQFMVLSILISTITGAMKKNTETDDNLHRLLMILKEKKQEIAGEKTEGRRRIFTELAAGLETEYRQSEQAYVVSETGRTRYHFLQTALQKLAKVPDEYEAVYQSLVNELKADITDIRERLHHMFGYIEAAFGSRALYVLMNRLTEDRAAYTFIEKNGCEDYEKHRDLLMLTDKRQDILNRIEERNESLHQK